METDNKILTQVQVTGNLHKKKAGELASLMISYHQAILQNHHFL
jgi:hypothetical protein